MKLTKECLYCKSTFTKPYNESRTAWEDRHKYCSKSCLAKATYHLTVEPYNFKKGVRNNPNGEFTVGSTAGDKNVKWKGAAASYAAKHMWIRYHYGKPQLCEHCGTTEKRMYHWANISRTFKRERSDWLRLCVPCHKKYDLRVI